ncbi:MAG: hypothetical protein QM820_01305 [Minicystis sp.]
MAQFFATTKGDGATGYLIANGNVYPATSGGNGDQYIPEGNYNYGPPEALDNSAKKHQWRTMSDHNPKTRSEFKKFHIGTGPKGGGEIWDESLKRWRKGIEFHYDGGNPGTEGCIGYQDPTARDALIADQNKTVSVKYVKDLEAARAEVEKALGHKVDWTKIENPKEPLHPGPGPQSNTKKGKKVKRGAMNTLSGPNHRQTAHLDSDLEGGGKIVMASKTVFVGRDQKGVARVEDDTTDGPVATGEPTILVG